MPAKNSNRPQFEVSYERARTVRANLEVLRRSNIGSLSAVLSTVGTKHRVPIVGVAYSKATLKHCVDAIVNNLRGLLDEAPFIRGFVGANANAMNDVLASLRAELTTLEIRQQIAEADKQRLNDAAARFLAANVAASSS